MVRSVGLARLVVVDRGTNAAGDPPERVAERRPSMSGSRVRRGSRHDLGSASASALRPRLGLPRPLASSPPMLNSGPPPPRPPLRPLDSGLATSGSPLGGGAVAGAVEAAGRHALGFLVVALGPLGLLAREADLPLGAVDAEDLDLDVVADVDDLLGAVDLVVGQLGDVQEPFEAGLELDEDAEVGQLGDLADDHVAGARSGPGCRSPRGRP